MLRDMTVHGCSPQAQCQQSSKRCDMSGHNRRACFAAFARDRYFGPMSHQPMPALVQLPQDEVFLEDQMRVLARGRRVRRPVWSNRKRTSALAIVQVAQANRRM